MASVLRKLFVTVPSAHGVFQWFRFSPTKYEAMYIKNAKINRYLKPVTSEVYSDNPPATNPIRLKASALSRWRVSLKKIANTIPAISIGHEKNMIDKQPTLSHRVVLWM